jgi:hypothetical protein
MSKCKHEKYSPSYSYNLGCRCDRCREYNRLKQRRIVAAAKGYARKGKGCAHPTLSPCTAYQYGCRCKRCSASNSNRHRAWRAAKK